MRKSKLGSASDLICEAILKNGGSCTIEQGVKIHMHLFGNSLSHTVAAYKNAMHHGYITCANGVYTMTPEAIEAYSVARRLKDAARASRAKVKEVVVVHPNAATVRVTNGFRTAMPVYRVTRAECAPLNPRCNGRSEISKETLIRGAAI